MHPLVLDLAVTILAGFTVSACGLGAILVLPWSADPAGPGRGTAVPLPRVRFSGRHLPACARAGTGPGLATR